MADERIETCFQLQRSMRRWLQEWCGPVLCLAAMTYVLRCLPSTLGMLGPLLTFACGAVAAVVSLLLLLVVLLFTVTERYDAQRHNLQSQPQRAGNGGQQVPVGSVQQVNVRKKTTDQAAMAATANASALNLPAGKGISPEPSSLPAGRLALKGQPLTGLLQPQPSTLLCGTYVGTIWTIPASTWHRSGVLQDWPPSIEGPAAVAYRWAAELNGSVLKLRPLLSHQQQQAQLQGHVARAPQQVEVQMAGTEVVLVQECLLGRSIWWKRGPLEISHKSQPLLYGQRCFYLWAEHGSNKEQWFVALRVAAHNSTADHVGDTLRLYTAFSAEVHQQSTVPLPLALPPSQPRVPSNASLSAGGLTGKPPKAPRRGWLRIFGRGGGLRQQEQQQQQQQQQHSDVGSGSDRVVCAGAAQSMGQQALQEPRLGLVRCFSSGSVAQTSTALEAAQVPLAQHCVSERSSEGPAVASANTASTNDILQAVTGTHGASGAAGEATVAKRSTTTKLMLDPLDCEVLCASGGCTVPSALPPDTSPAEITSLQRRQQQQQQHLIRNAGASGLGKAGSSCCGEGSACCDISGDGSADGSEWRWDGSGTTRSSQPAGILSQTTFLAMQLTKSLPDVPGAAMAAVSAAAAYAARAAISPPPSPSHAVKRILQGLNTSSSEPDLCSEGARPSSLLTSLQRILPRGDDGARYDSDSPGGGSPLDGASPHGFLTPCGSEADIQLQSSVDDMAQTELMALSGKERLQSHDGGGRSDTPSKAEQKRRDQLRRQLQKMEKDRLKQQQKEVADHSKQRQREEEAQRKSEAARIKLEQDAKHRAEKGRQRDDRLQQRGMTPNSSAQSLLGMEARLQGSPVEPDKNGGGSCSSMQLKQFNSTGSLLNTNNSGSATGLTALSHSSSAPNASDMTGGSSSTGAGVHDATADAASPPLPLDRTMGHAVDGMHGLNMLLTRLGFELLRAPLFHNLIRNLLQKRLDDITRPPYLDQLELTDMSFGTSVPLVRSIKAVAGPANCTPGQPLWPQLLVEVAYQGNLSATIKTKIELQKAALFSSLQNTLGRMQKEPGDPGSWHTSEDGMGPHPGGSLAACLQPATATAVETEQVAASTVATEAVTKAAVQLPGLRRKGRASPHTSRPGGMLGMLRLKRFAAEQAQNLATNFAESLSRLSVQLVVRVTRFEGTIMLWVAPPPSDRLWYSFLSPPQIDMSVTPVLASRVLRFSAMLARTSSWVRHKIVSALDRQLVFPGCGDLRLPPPFTSLDTKDLLPLFLPLDLHSTSQLPAQPPSPGRTSRELQTPVTPPSSTVQAGCSNKNNLSNAGSSLADAAIPLRSLQPEPTQMSIQYSHSNSATASTTMDACHPCTAANLPTEVPSERDRIQDAGMHSSANPAVSNCHATKQALSSLIGSASLRSVARAVHGSEAEPLGMAKEPVRPVMINTRPLVCHDAPLPGGQDTQLPVISTGIAEHGMDHSMVPESAESSMKGGFLTRQTAATSSSADMRAQVASESSLIFFAAAPSFSQAASLCHWGSKSAPLRPSAAVNSQQPSTMSLSPSFELSAICPSFTAHPSNSPMALCTAEVATAAAPAAATPLPSLPIVECGFLRRDNEPSCIPLSPARHSLDGPIQHPHNCTGLTIGRRAPLMAAAHEVGDRVGGTAGQAMAVTPGISDFDHSAASWTAFAPANAESSSSSSSSDGSERCSLHILPASTLQHDRRACVGSPAASGRTGPPVGQPCGSGSRGSRTKRAASWSTALAASTLQAHVAAQCVHVTSEEKSPVHGSVGGLGYKGGQTNTPAPDVLTSQSEIVSRTISADAVLLGRLGCISSMSSAVSHSSQHQHPFGGDDHPCVGQEALLSLTTRVVAPYIAGGSFVDRDTCAEPGPDLARASAPMPMAGRQEQQQQRRRPLQVTLQLAGRIGAKVGHAFINKVIRATERPHAPGNSATISPPVSRHLNTSCSSSDNCSSLHVHSPLRMGGERGSGGGVYKLGAIETTERDDAGVIALPPVPWVTLAANGQADTRGCTGVVQPDDGPRGGGLHTAPDSTPRGKTPARDDQAE